MILKPQLLTSIEPAELLGYASSSDWWFDQKVDGERVLLHVVDGHVTAINRRGEETKRYSDKLLAPFEVFPGEWYFDGEVLGDTIWLFDLPYVDGFVQPDEPFWRRRTVLSTFLKSYTLGPTVKVLPSAQSEHEKLDLTRRLLAAGCEGVVVKRAEAPYRSGKRTGDMLKAKFCHDVDAVVMALRADGHENMTVGCYDNGQLVPVAEVTLLAGDGMKARIGDVVTVKYLYARQDNRRLIQPTNARLRADKAPEECTIDQLAYASKEVLQP